MSMGYLEVIAPGLLSTIQDSGRYGMQASGFSVSGCMDQEAYHDANVLVNNRLTEAVIEMQFLGGTFLFHAHTFFVLTGADMQPKLQGKTIQNYKAYEVREGDKLELSAAVNGRFTYLAIASGIRTESELGSRSTNLKCGIGGFQGRALLAGDHIPIRADIKELLNAYLKEMPSQHYSKQIVLHVLKGPQDNYFTEKGLHTFESELYSVSDQSDRMGYRMAGTSIEYKDKVDILSDGIVFGSIQIPPAGTPMIMMADRQTTGGYAKIATVIKADLPLLAQSMPGTDVRFCFISLKDAYRMDIKQRKRDRRFRWKSGYCKPKER